MAGVVPSLPLWGEVLLAIALVVFLLGAAKWVLKILLVLAVVLGAAYVATQMGVAVPGVVF